MQAVTINTSAGPLTVDTEPGNPAAPIRVKLGQGFPSMTVFLNVEQAEAILSALDLAHYEAKRSAKGGAA